LRKILHVSSTAAFIENFLLDNIEYLVRNDFDVFTVCFYDNSFTNIAKNNGFSYFPIRITRSYSPISDYSAIRNLVSFIKRHQFDTVIGHTPKWAFVAMVAAKIANVQNSSNSAVNFFWHPYFPRQNPV